MNLLKYKVLVVGGSVALVCAAGACFGLFHFQSKYSKAAAELKSANDRLDRLNRRNPFPKAENTTIVQQNRDKMNDFVASLRDDFRKGQVASETMEPAKFASFLDGVRKDVRARAVAAKSKIPDQASLGFARYVAGALPSEADIPRLVVQARTVGALCEVIFEARIEELVDLQRTHFETAVDVAGTPGGAPAALLPGESGPASTLLNAIALPPIESNELFSAERFGIVFVGREYSGWEVMNALARCGLFAVLRHVELENVVNPKQPGGLPGAAPVAPPPPPTAPGVAAPVVIHPPREERVVAGREQVRVSMVVDVYRFAGPPVGEESK
jgi:hypothetical protein